VVYDYLGPALALLMPTARLFDVSLVASAARREPAVSADGEGLDVLGIQDQLYGPHYLNTFVLAGDLLSVTQRIGV
jgi:alkanesulfonate monooxygenase SsuD/methylene tetrahydromethanopterin reductase-like flavin-dependent oxidoreductase (luciferase family)